jgi:hypothetical protein
VRVERDDVVGVGEGAVGRVLVARFSVVDVIAFLSFLLVADHRRALGHGLLGARDRRERLVVDVDQLERVLRDVRGLGDDSGDLLALEADLVRREHGLGIPRSVGIQASECCTSRSPVTTATTPSSPCAREVSMPVIRACANGLRRISM